MSIFTNPNKNSSNPFDFNSIGFLNPIVPNSTSNIFI